MAGAKNLVFATVLGLGGVSGAMAQEMQMTQIIDFSDPDPSVRWYVVNDGVMGGRSSSDIALTEEGTGLFSGHVSLENNGGFASIRASFQAMDLSPYPGVLVRVRGDGRRYQLRFRLAEAFDGVAYRAEFETEAGAWKDIRLPFADFKPTFRGRTPPGVAPLDPSRIRQIGFLIADKTEGPFRLEVAWVKPLSPLPSSSPEKP
jgi:monofunctional biosynthetic peptidoglycan transglycosylase